jgi:hypothetical protein
VAADQGHLRDHTLHPPIDCANHQNVRAAVARAPDTNPIRIGIRQFGGVSYGIAIVADLRPRIDLLARLAVAGAEVAIVEHDRREAGLHECFRKSVEIHLLNGGEAVRHYDRGILR